MMGNRKGTNDTRFETHNRFYSEYSRECDVLVVENVVEYGEDITKSALGPSWAVTSICFDPRNVGMGIARARIYLLCWKTNKVTWTAPFSLKELLESLASRHVLTARNYFWQKLPATVLTSAEERCQVSSDQLNEY